MWIVGLTGGIAAGKSTLAKGLEEMGIPVHSSDKEVHALLHSDPTVQKEIKLKWPDVFVKGKIDRRLLGDKALSSPTGLSFLEDLLYSKLTRHQKDFLLKHKKLKTPIVCLDVPLLFEVGLDRYCHVVLLASTPLFMRKERVLRRDGMTLEKFLIFEANQMPESERRKRADFIISCRREKGSALKSLHRIINFLSQRPSPRWNGRWPTTLKRISYGSGNRSRHGNDRP